MNSYIICSTFLPSLQKIFIHIIPNLPDKIKKFHNKSFIFIFILFFKRKEKEPPTWNNGHTALLTVTTNCRPPRSGLILFVVTVVVTGVRLASATGDLNRVTSRNVNHIRTGLFICWRNPRSQTLAIPLWIRLSRNRFYLRVCLLVCLSTLLCWLLLLLSGLEKHLEVVR